MPYIESFEEFSERQNCEKRFIGHRDMWLFQNTAMWRLSDNAHAEPAEEGSVEWLNRRHAYESDRYDQLRRIVESMQESISIRTSLRSEVGMSVVPCSSVVPVTEAEVEAVKAAAKDATAARKIVEELAERLYHADKAGRHREQLLAEQAARARASRNNARIALGIQV